MNTRPDRPADTIQAADRRRSVVVCRWQVQRRAGVLAACLLLSTLTRSAVAETDWPMFRGNARLTGVATSDLPRGPAVAWTFHREEAFSGTPAIVGDTVFAPCEDGVLYALGLADGKARWTCDTKSPIRSSPTVADGVVLFGNEAGELHAVDAGSGARRWMFQTSGEIISSPNLAGPRVVFGSYDGTLYALNRSDGALAWKCATEDRLHATCVIANESALVGGCDGALHVVRLADGTQPRMIELGAVTGSSAAFDGRRAYLGTYGNEVLAIDPEAASVTWRYSDKEREFPFMASPAVHAGLVIIGGRDKRLRAFDVETGAQKWEFAARGRIDSSPVVVGDRVFFGCSDGNLYAVRLADGEKVWNFEAAEPMTASPAVARGRLVIGTLDGTLYCFK